MLKTLAPLLILASSLSAETYRTVSGVVTNAAGAPVENAQIYLNSSQPQQSTTSDELGRYVFKDVDALGGISFVVNIDGKRPAVARFTTVSNEKGRLWIDIKIAEKGTDLK